MKKDFRNEKVTAPLKQHVFDQLPSSILPISVTKKLRPH